MPREHQSHIKRAACWRHARPEQRAFGDSAHLNVVFSALSDWQQAVALSAEHLDGLELGEHGHGVLGEHKGHGADGAIHDARHIVVVTRPVANLLLHRLEQRIWTHNLGLVGQVLRTAGKRVGVQMV